MVIRNTKPFPLKHSGILPPCPRLHELERPCRALHSLPREPDSMSSSSRHDGHASRWRIHALIVVVALCLVSSFMYVFTARQEQQILASNLHPTGNFRSKSSRPSVPVPRYLSPNEIFQVHFPQCLPSPRLMEGQGPGSLPQKWLYWLNDTTTTTMMVQTTTTTTLTTNRSSYDDDSESYVAYVPSKTPPRYDHVSCTVMKARYNCALSRTNDTTTIPGKPTGAIASDYKFLWRHHVPGPWCDLQALTEFVRGPSSISQKSVLLQGNSYLRQIWEAMVCGFQSQITNLTLLRHGPRMSLGYIASRSGKLLQTQEVGTFMINQQDIPGCHAPSRGSTMLSTYYAPHVTIPPDVEHCSDDMAMVEFGHSLRIFFLFHPSRFQSDALFHAYSQLDVPEPLDIMAWMERPEDIFRNRTTIHQDSAPPWSLEGILLSSLKRVQEASVGYFFGADNPGITNPPDNHPCLPGIPDDEANIFIYLLLLEEYERTSITTHRPKHAST
jgi:hypothetical protein